MHGRSPNVRSLLHLIFRIRLFYRVVWYFSLYAGNSRALKWNSWRHEMSHCSIRHCNRVVGSESERERERPRGASPSCPTASAGSVPEPSPFCHSAHGSGFRAYGVRGRSRANMAQIRQSRHKKNSLVHIVPRYLLTPDRNLLRSASLLTETAKGHQKWEGTKSLQGSITNTPDRNPLRFAAVLGV